MHLKSIIIKLMKEFTIMKVNQSAALNPELIAKAKDFGMKLSRFRIARGVKQADAALRAGLSRNTVYRMESGDPGVAFGQILRYVDALAPGITLLQIMSESDPSLAALNYHERTKRVRDLSQREIAELDF
jgi:DNA-binding XRE family transcriptional regulator